MGVEQRELLVAVNHVAGVVDVQRHRIGRRRMAVEPQIEHRSAEADHTAPVGRVLPARHRRLRAQVPSAVRQPAAGELERRIKPQAIQVVGVFAVSSCTFCRSASANNITPPSEVIRPPSKAAATFFRPTAGNANGRDVSSVMADVAGPDAVRGLASTTKSYATSIAYVR